MTWLKKGAIAVLLLAGALGAFALAIQVGGLIRQPGAQGVGEATDEEVASLRRAGLDGSPTADATEDEATDDEEESEEAEQDEDAAVGEDEEAASDGEKGSLQTVSNTLLGLSFEIPRDYTVSDEKPYGPSSMSITTYKPGELEPSDDFPSGHMKIEIFEAEKSPETSLSAWLEGQETELEPGPRTQVAVDGKEAVSETGVGYGAHINYYINIGDGVVVAAAYVNESEIELQEEVFGEIVNSFRFGERGQ